MRKVPRVHRPCFGHRRRNLVVSQQDVGAALYLNKGPPSLHLYASPSSLPLVDPVDCVKWVPNTASLKSLLMHHAKGFLRRSEVGRPGCRIGLVRELLRTSEIRSSFLVRPTRPSPQGATTGLHKPYAETRHLTNGRSAFESTTHSIYDHPVARHSGCCYAKYFFNDLFAIVGLVLNRRSAFTRGSELRQGTLPGAAAFCLLRSGPRVRGGT